MKKPPRVLIEEWLPATAIGVECIRERSTGQQPPDKRFHVWWARRPLTVSRAAVLGSILPATFPKDVFEKLLGFWGSSRQLHDAQRSLDYARLHSRPIDNPHGQRAFKNRIPTPQLDKMRSEAKMLWGSEVRIMDPMAGGGSIPLEGVRLGLSVLANEYNPVACSVLEATLDYPFRYGELLAYKARVWGEQLRKRFVERVEEFFPQQGNIPPHCYIFARTVPCPDTQHPTPLIPDWHLLKPKTGRRVVAEPIHVNPESGTWSIRTRDIGKRAGELREAPLPTYSGGKGISLFTGNPISSDYIKAKAQSGEMESVLYAIAYKTPQGLEFFPPEKADLEALDAAKLKMNRLRADWERKNIIPAEDIPQGDKTGEPMARGIYRWADMFSPRQLFCMGTLVDELQKLRSEVIKEEGKELGEAIVHLLALAMDKYADYNNLLNTWESSRGIAKHLFQRHDFAFKATYAEMAPCQAGSGLAWVVDNVTSAYEDLVKLDNRVTDSSVNLSNGSSANLSLVEDGSITAVVVDPPYDDNVQYSELANFFYVWLKRTQGHRRPEWFSTYLCDHSQEAVVNVSRHLESTTTNGKKRERGETAAAREKARTFYRTLMTDTFKECRRVLRDDGVLTVMFTHKKQEAWEALFTSLINAGFTITATWPVKTESEHSLHQAKKNAAQSTVLLVARKRPTGAGKGYYDSAMKEAIRKKAQEKAAQLANEGLNRVDQLVGSFGPAMEVYSQFDEVVTDTGEHVGVDQAIDEASEAVSKWRIDQLAGQGLEGVEPEGQFELLCWDVLGAAEFRFNEAHLLGKAVGMDVDQLIVAGLVTKVGDKIHILSAQDRRRERALEPDEATETLFGPVTISKRRTKKDALKVHPNDPQFRTALDACHALALQYIEAKDPSSSIGAAKALMRKQGWNAESTVAKLMVALVNAAPDAVKFPKKKQKTAADMFPEFSAWHAMLNPLFGIEPPDWAEPPPPLELALDHEDEDEEEESEETGDEE